MRRLLLAVVLLLAPVRSLAADHYVREGAVGDNTGTNWTNAWTDLPATFTRGDTYWVADGTYGPHTFSTAASGESRITIKKAIAADHGTETGWDSSYGDGVATFTGAAGGGRVWDVRTPYWTFDGQVGGGPTSWKSGHGIRVSATDNTVNVRLLNLHANSDYSEFKHVDFAHSGVNTGQCTDAIYAFEGASTSNHTIGILISYCYIHHVDRGQIGSAYGDGWLVEYTNIAYRSTTATCHGEGWSANYDNNHVLRYNLVQDIAGTGYLVFKNGAPSDNIVLYGNIFVGTESYENVSNGTITDLTTDMEWLTNLKVYNNTFVHLRGPGGPRHGGGAHSGLEAYNNLFYDAHTSPGNVIGASYTKDYNWFYDSTHATETHEQVGAGDPFTDWQNYDFSLIDPTNPGVTLLSPYNIDMFGNVRGADNVWDRGAIEYVDEGGGGGGWDNTPNQFYFTDLSNASRSTPYTSNSITVTGIDNVTSISISGGSGEYRINAGSWTSAPGNVNLNDNVAVRLTSSGAYSTSVSTTLDIGGVTESYSVTTLRAPGVWPPDFDRIYPPRHRPYFRRDTRLWLSN